MQKDIRERILALDLLRGYFLLVIIVDHLFRFPSLFEALTGRGQLWVSAAEGFFIISGLLVGYIYKEKIITSPRLVLSKIWRRAGKLYLLSIGLTLLFTVWGWVLNSVDVKLGIWPLGFNPGLMIIKTLTLQYVYGWADFLPFYAVFLFFAPLCLWLLARRNFLAVVLLSFVIWVVRGNNFYLAWQILFVGGMMGGFYYDKIEGFLGKLSEKTKRILTVTLFATTVTTILISTFFVFGVWTIFRASWVNELPVALLSALAVARDAYFPLQTAWFDKISLPPIRLILAALWFIAALVLVRRQEKFLARLFGGVLLLFGKNSLLVYVAHGFLLFPSFLYLPVNTGFLENTLIDLAMIGVVYVVVRWREIFIDNMGRLFFNLVVFFGLVRLDVLSSEEDGV